MEAAAQGVLDTRKEFPDATLADLYDPLAMPPALISGEIRVKDSTIGQAVENG